MSLALLASFTTTSIESYNHLQYVSLARIATFSVSFPQCSSCSTQTEQTELHGIMHSIQVRGLSSLLFSRYCAEQFECTECTVPDDFLLYAARAMSQLSVSNTLAKGFGCMRADRSDSLFPTNRMPMGLLEFMANFFVSSESRKVSDA